MEAVEGDPLAAQRVELYFAAARPPVAWILPGLTGETTEDQVSRRGIGWLPGHMPLLLEAALAVAPGSDEA